MTNQEISKKAQALKELKIMAEELQDEITALEDAIKAELTAQNTDTLIAGPFKINWTRYTSSRFDTKSFKATHAELYKQYTVTTEARRFTIA